MPNNKIQSLTVNGVTYDIVDTTSGYIDAQYIENKTDYEIPVSRVGEIIVGETVIGTESTNFPTSKAVVDYVDERVVQEIDAIDVGVTGIKVNGTNLAIENGVVNILYSIPTTTSQLTNDSGFITASDVSTNETDPTVPAWAKASTKPTYTASEVGALSSDTVITDEKLKVSLTSDNDTYYPILTSNSTEAQTKLRYSGLDFTIASDGAQLKIGNASISTPRMGKLTLTRSTYFTTIVPSNNGHSNTITLPNKTGTVALLDDIPTIPTNISSFTNDAGYLTSYTETDPTVPSWAKQSSKPTYSLTEISGTDDLRVIEGLTGTTGLLKKTAANTWTLDTNTYLTSYTETDPTVPAWAKADTKPSYTFSEIGSKPTTISGYGITDAYTKTEVDNKVSAVLRYKGVKAAISNLPTTGNVVGDVWHVTATSGEYAWDGTEWQELGTAITIPAATGSSTTGISIADHSTTTIYGVSSSTTSVTGVSGSTSVYGVKSGTNSTTTASHVASGGNGTAPTLGTAISVYGVKSGTNSTTTASHVKSGGNGSAPTLGTAFSIPNVTGNSDVTVPIRADADTTVPTAASSATTVPIKDASATACDDITAWSAGSGSLTFTMDTTDTKKLVISHTHTAPSLSYTARSIIGVQSSTTSVTGVSGSTTVRGVKTGTSSTTTASKVTLGTAFSVPNVTSAGSASNWVFEDVTVPIRADSATSIPNVTSVGSAANWVFEDVTVPIRADSATTVPTAASSATTVPIKDLSSTTVVTSKTHSVTDNGHTHTI